MADRDVYWAGSSYEDLMEFPDDAMNAAGFQLRKAQQDKEPDDWKPMQSVGPGVREIRIFAEAGAYRVMYVVKIAGLVHVLHCFHKRTEQTSQRDRQRSSSVSRS